MLDTKHIISVGLIRREHRQMAARDMYSASIATAIAEIVTLPLCTLKTNYQNTHSSIRETIFNIWKHHGVRGFYRASFPAIASQVLTTTLKYTLYNQLKRECNTFAAGALSGILSSLVTHPIDVVKVHWQMATPLRPVFIREGCKFFYRGYKQTLIKTTCGSALFYPLFDIFHEYTNAFLASVASAIVSTTLTQPIDYIKTRRMYGLSLNGWNILPYYRGLSLNLGRVVPHFTITMTMIDYLKRSYDN